MTSLACCSGSVDQGQPTGHEEAIGGLTCYVAHPPTHLHPHRVVLICTDIFGFRSPNIRLIGDQFAKALNCRCIIPDAFKGTEPPISLMSSVEGLLGSKHRSSWWFRLKCLFHLLACMIPFLWHNTYAVNRKRYQAVMKALKEDQGVTQMGVQGYCWGGRFAVRFAQQTDAVDVASCAHPAQLRLPEDLELLKRPVCFVLSEEDRELGVKERAGMLKILETKKEREGYTYALKMFEGTVHGFAVRGQDDDPEVRVKRQEAFRMACEFMSSVWT